MVVFLRIQPQPLRRIQEREAAERADGSEWMKRATTIAGAVRQRTVGGVLDDVDTSLIAQTSQAEHVR